MEDRFCTNCGAELDPETGRCPNCDPAPVKRKKKSSAIIWIVDVILLLISRYALDCRAYHDSAAAITWASCDLREWLNGSFYQTAFTQEEQGRILTTAVAAQENPKFATAPGADSEDKVFLLSATEAEAYFATNRARLCGPTAYATGRGVYVSGATGGCWWWLRTPGNTSMDACSVNSDGSIDYDDGSVSSPKGAVRPVIWIKAQ